MAQPQPDFLSATQVLRMSTNSFLRRKIWLPRAVYEALPFAYISVGFAALFATLYIPEWYWTLPFYFLFAFGVIHFGVHIWVKRFSARAARLARSTQTES